MLAVNGRIMLTDGQEYPCVARNISLRNAEIIAQCAVEMDTIVVCYLDNIGILPGKSVERTKQGFICAFAIPGARRQQITARLEWHASQASEAAELRRAPRIVPTDPVVAVSLGERIVLTGRILDISLSGAAIRLDGNATPFEGARVRVGNRFAKVVRLIEGGIAVMFDVPFASRGFDERVRP